ncbi:MAG: pitrilysin family protein [Kofleriaceae bacterium]
MLAIHRSVVAALVVLSTVSLPALAQPRRPVAIDIPFQEFTLANGLRVIVHTDRKAPIVAVNVWYHVGSKNEPLGRSGFAHLFEHLMFQRSENHKGEYFDPFELVGATGQNGTTNSDRTNYFVNVPTTALDMALWMESDRMGHLLGAVDQAGLDEQRGVVQNEKRQGENQPYGRAYELMLAASYPDGHPYHHTTIGSMTDLSSATLDDVKNWFRSWYGPNNAVLVLAGDIDLATAKAKVTRYFGDIAPTATVPRLKPLPAPRKTTTRATATDQVPQTRVHRVWNVPQDGTADVEHLELFAHVLGGGRSSRLERRLVHVDRSVDMVAVGLDTSELGSMFVIEADVKQGGDATKVEKAIDEELRKLLTAGPTAAELASARTVLKANFLRGIERIGGFGGKSDILAKCTVLVGKTTCFRDALRIQAAATPGTIKATANRWLSRGDHVLVITPGERKPMTDPPAVTNLPPTKVAAPDKRLKVVKTDVDRTTGVPVTASYPNLVFPKLQRATLSNGLKVVLAERPGLPIVQLRLEVRGAGFALDKPTARGTAAFTMGMLDEGAGDLDALALGKRIEALGARIEARASLDTATINVNALSENLDLSLALFADMLVRPRFDDKELERVRAQWLAQLKQEKADPQQLSRRLVRPLMFGDPHPYATTPNGRGNEAAITALKRDNLTAWAKQKLRPDASTLLVVGAISLADLQPRLEKALAAWKPPATRYADLAIPMATQPARPRVFLVDQPGAIQANIVVGQIVPSSTDASALELEIASSVLGGEFSSRLNMNLRESKHWAYGAYAGVADAIGQRAWQASAAVQIDKTAESVKELHNEIAELAQGKAPATAAEVTKIQSLEVRALPGYYETGSALLNSMSEIVLFGRPDNWPAQRVQRIQALTPTKVNAITAKLRPESLTWVIVGDLKKIEAGVRALKLGDVKVLDADGKVLR